MGERKRKHKPRTTLIFTKPFPVVLKVVGNEIYMILKDDVYFVIPLKQASRIFSFLKEFFAYKEYRLAMRGRLFTVKDLKD